MLADYTNNREELVALLGKNVKGEKFQHSLGVEQTALKLAERFGVCRERAGLAGLLHDITKQMDNVKLARKYGIISLSDKTLHGPVAACWLKEQGITEDAEVLTAIKYHTTGRADMSLLEKIIYIADYIEPARDFEGVEKVRRAAEQDIDRAMLMGIVMSLEDILQKGSLIDPDSVAAYNYFRWIVKD